MHRFIQSTRLMNGIKSANHLLLSHSLKAVDLMRLDDSCSRVLMAKAREIYSGFQAGKGGYHLLVEHLGSGLGLTIQAKEPENPGR